MCTCEVCGILGEKEMYRIECSVAVEEAEYNIPALEYYDCARGCWEYIVRPGDSNGFSLGRGEKTVVVDVEVDAVG